MLHPIVAFSQIGVGEWRDHLPYKRSIGMIEAQGKIYCATESGILIHNKFDNSLEKLSKINDTEYDGVSPEIELLEYHDQVMALYRKGASKDHLELAKIFRRAAHKIYRMGLKQNLLSRNNKFLNVVPL